MQVVQLLEGPRSSVIGLYAIISLDQRHTDCQLIEERVVHRRLYAGFGMAFARLEDAKLAIIKQTTQKGTLDAEMIHVMRLQYSSILLANDGDEGKRLIGQILERAIPFNGSMQIGGLLCFNPTTLAVTQVLEGPAPAVLDLFDRIVADKRHRAVQLTSQEVVIDPSDLQFDARWGMMQVETDDDELLDLAARLRKAFAPFEALGNGQLKDVLQAAEAQAEAQAEAVEHPDWRAGGAVLLRSPRAEEEVRAVRQRKIDETVGRKEAEGRKAQDKETPFQRIVEATPAFSDMMS